MSNFKVIKQNILNRRNIKPEKMNGKQIDEAIIAELLELANWAPTHKLTEPWRFVVFTEESLAKFASYHALLYKQETPKEKYLQKKFDRLLSRAQNASHIIAVVNKRDEKARVPELEELAATSIAVQNIWLGATALDIACYWGSGAMTYHPAMKEHLGFNASDQVLGLFYLGYTDDAQPEGKRLSESKAKISYKTY